MADMDALEPWLADIAARLTPGRRRALAGKIGRVMRGENAKRVQANVEPDGTVMAARNPKKPRPNAKRSVAGRQPAGACSSASNWRRTCRSRPRRTVPGYRSRGVAGTAKVHHFGLEDAVDHRIRNSIRVRYKARRLLGFGPGDRDTMTAEIMAWLNGE
jgi:phage virion morphogenesis protein